MNNVLKRLSRSARASCRYREHDMGNFKHMRHDRLSPYDPHTMIAYCRVKNCDASVVINDHPAPNQIDIGGDAVAVTCPVVEEITQ